MSVAAPLRVETQDAAETLDWVFDWSDFLGPFDRITASVWASSGAAVIASTTFGGSLSTGWISAQTAGATSDISNTITTAQGRIAKRSFQLLGVSK